MPGSRVARRAFDGSAGTDGVGHLRRVQVQRHEAEPRLLRRLAGRARDRPNVAAVRRDPLWLGLTGEADDGIWGVAAAGPRVNPDLTIDGDGGLRPTRAFVNLCEWRPALRGSPAPWP